jgi:hypothetical protein
MRRNLWRNLNDAVDHAGARFSFQVTEEDAMVFRRLLVGHQRRYISRRLVIGIPLAGFACITIPIWIAYDQDVLPISAVLIAEFSFVVGYLGLRIAMAMASRRLYRDLFRASRSTQASFACTFDDAGLTVKKGARETRMTWEAVSDVQNEGAVVAFWYDPTQGFFIPGRVFSNDAARIAFAAWARDRARAAHSSGP